MSNIPWQSLSDRFKTAELFGKLANIFADLPSKSVDDNGFFKSLTGEDYITGEKKNKNPFSFKPNARLLFSCNEIPKNRGDKTEAFYRRLIIIRFEKAVPIGKRDPNLREKLTQEADGIFMFALEGLKRLIANNYVFSETANTKTEVERYKIESNSVLSFAAECCELKDDYRVPRMEIYESYREYCKQNGLMPTSQIRFNRELEVAFPQVQRISDKVGKRKCWVGIKLSNKEMDF